MRGLLKVCAAIDALKTKPTTPGGEGEKPGEGNKPGDGKKPGDVIASGTPQGVGPMKVGDLVEVSIDGIGSLRNICAS